MEIRTIIAAITLTAGSAATAAPPVNIAEANQAFGQSCQQERRQALASCRINYENMVKKLIKQPKGDTLGTWQIENTMRSLCEMEAEREYDVCNISSKFSNFSISDLIEQSGIGEDAFSFVKGDGTGPVEIEDVEPLLSGSNYRTLSQLCNSLPGGYGSTLDAWTGVNPQWDCHESLWDACMNDPQMGSNAVGTGSDDDFSSEREENCTIAFTLLDIPVL